MSSPHLDPVCLRAFVAVADSGSFTAAARRLLRGQSAVSLQVRRLEEQLGQRLLDRGPRHAVPTAAGERVLAQARLLLALNDALVSAAREPELDGVVRLGVPEDFATTHLPAILAEFARTHPRVALEVTCELTLPLLDRFGAGEFDLVLVKRMEGGEGQDVVLREQLVWAAAGPGRLADDPAQPVPLVCSPRPCVLRDLATRALESAGRSWRIAYTCGSLAGNHAAVRAGLGVAPLPLEMVPADLAVLSGEGLPPLPGIETAMLEAGALGPAAQRLRDTIRTARQRGILTA